MTDSSSSSAQLPLVFNDILQVPLHQLSKQFKNSQKVQEQGANVALKALKDLLQRVSAKEQAGDSVSADKIVAALDKIKAKLLEVRELVTTSSAEMEVSLESLSFRLAMRNGASLVQESHDPKRARPSQESTTERMLELAIISNHLLRTNRFETYRVLCKEANCAFLLGDSEIFQSHRDIYRALTERHDADPALAWCIENKYKLKKRNSSFEFDLRLRQFYEIVQRGETKEAVLFARKYLAQNANDDKMRRAMATLAFPSESLMDTPYKQSMLDERWIELADRFLQERNSSLNLNPVSPLEIVVKLGLAVTRTQSCRPDGPGRAAGCPACQPSLGKLALAIPRTLRQRSTLVCRISGLVMEDPLVLPNGQAYSKASLEQMTQQRGDGKVCCPLTHQEFYLKDAKRAFVL